MPIMNFIQSHLYSDAKLIKILVAWFLLGLFMAWQYAFRRQTSRAPKLINGLLFLLIGPLFFPVWMLGGTLWRMLRARSPFPLALKSHLAGDAMLMPLSDSYEDDDTGDLLVMYDTNGQPVATTSLGKSEKAAAGLRLTRKIVSGAVTQKASDILIHPVNDTTFGVRFRINGTLRNVEEISDEEGRSVVNAIKALSGMDIAQRRRPQDGGFTARASHGDVSFRVATAGVLNGEKVSVRVLDQSASAFSLTSVGLSASEQTQIKKALSAGSGMVLVCGPTGSGKSSTVHAMLRTIDSIERNVITIEDPIEYILPNASQIEINTKAGLTFASALRSVLRQDPDVISVGEIRDAETAEIALQAAQTGHLVFATIHSGSNMAAILRLADLGCQSELIASALNVVVSQRLVRRLCDHCKSKEKFGDNEKAELWKQAIDPDSLYGPRGCDHCHDAGYGGRTGVFDILFLDRALRDQVARGELNSSTEPGGHQMSAMQVRATQMALSGIVSWEEVQRVAASGD